MMDYWRCKLCGIAIDTKTVEKNDGICVVCYGGFCSGFVDFDIFYIRILGRCRLVSQEDNRGGVGCTKGTHRVRCMG